MLQKLSFQAYIGTHVHIIYKKADAPHSCKCFASALDFSTYHKIAAADRILLKIIDK